MDLGLTTQLDRRIAGKLYDDGSTSESSFSSSQKSISRKLGSDSDLMDVSSSRAASPPVSERIYEALVCPKSHTLLQSPVFSRKLEMTVSYAWASEHPKEAGDVVTDRLAQGLSEAFLQAQNKASDEELCEALLAEMRCPMTFLPLVQPVIGGFDGQAYSYPMLHDYATMLQQRKPGRLDRMWTFDKAPFISSFTGRPQNLGDCHPHMLADAVLRIVMPEEVLDPPPASLPRMVDPRAIGLPAAFGSSSRSAPAWEETLLLFSTWRRPRLSDASCEKWTNKASCALKRWEIFETSNLNERKRKNLLKKMVPKFKRLYNRLPQMRLIPLIYADLLLFKNRLDESIKVLEALRERDVEYGYPTFSDISGRLLVLYSRRGVLAEAAKERANIDILRGGIHPSTKPQKLTQERLIDLRLDWGAGEYALLEDKPVEALRLFKRAWGMAENAKVSERHELFARVKHAQSLAHQSAVAA